MRIIVQYLQYKNTESGYYIVKCRSKSYTLQSYIKLVKDVLKALVLVCDDVYLNPHANSKKWYKPYEDEKMKRKLLLV